MMGVCAMRREVEAKFRVPCAELRLLEELAEANGFKCREASEERDIYFNHPCRSFEETDEALRVRVRGGHIYITYKGPKRLVESVKEREEIEVKVDGGLDDVRTLLSRLGFSEVASVHKRRVYCKNGLTTVTLDEVEGLGCFVEVEGPSREAIQEVADLLGLSRFERVALTYLEMVLRGLKGEKGGSRAG
jgi:adenylate cyclase class 2